MNRFKKSKYIIVLFAVAIIVGVFLVTTKSSTFVTKVMVFLLLTEWWKNHFSGYLL